MTLDHPSTSEHLLTHGLVYTRDMIASKRITAHERAHKRSENQEQLTSVRLITLNDSEVVIGDAWVFDTRKEALAHLDDMSVGDNQVAILSDMDGTIGEVRQS